MKICAICAHARQREMLSLSGIPVHVGILCSSPAEARATPRGEMQLTLCMHCGYVCNTAFEEHAMTYGSSYDISLTHSPTYLRFLEDTAHRLVSAYQIRRRRVIEIGSGNGTFLNLLCLAGDNRGTGFDPTAEAPRIANPDIEFIRDYYSSQYAAYRADLFCCRHVLEHIADPLTFLRNVRTAIGDSTPILYFEVPNMDYIVESGSAWNLFYEHCSYFTEDSLRGLFAAAGFEVLLTEPCYEQGQYLAIHAIPDRASLAYTPPEERFVTALRHLAASIGSDRDYWNGLLRQLDRENRQVVAWGAGARAVSFLHGLEEESRQVEAVVDINPLRSGRYLPGTGTPVIAPQQLPAIRPDIILITNPTYTEEIRSQVSDLDLSAELLTISGPRSVPAAFQASRTAAYGKGRGATG
jgi:SAM-dependent methyltransferase